MKLLLIPVLVLLLAPLRLVAASSIAYENVTVGSTLPGDGADFDFLGNYGIKNTPDFTLTEQYGGGYGHSVADSGSQIETPTGYSPATLETTSAYVAYQAGLTDLADYTMGSNSTFNYADFNAYVMFSNIPAYTSYLDTSITLILQTADGTTLASLTQPVSDANTSMTSADFIEFNVQGGTTGDVLRVEATGASGLDSYLGGVSLVSVPEPSVYALLMGGLALLGFARRFRRTC